MSLEIPEKKEKVLLKKAAAGVEKAKEYTGSKNKKDMVRTITLRCVDGEEFKVEKEIVKELGLVSNIIKDTSTCNNLTFILPIVTGPVLAKVVEYWKHHLAMPAAEKGSDAELELKQWDSEFVKMGKYELLHLIRAANYLGCPQLVELTCKAVADKMEEMRTVEQLRNYFGFKSDFTEEEEAKVRRENRWAFE